MTLSTAPLSTVTASALSWWRDRAQLRRVVRDAVADEAARLRPGSPVAALSSVLAWDEGLEIGPGGLGADSLELIALATALTERFHLHRAGLEDYLLARRTLGDWIDIVGESLARFDAEISFRSSGSVGAPKTCRHRLARLEEEAAALRALIGPRARVCSAAPAHHIYGFIVTVLTSVGWGTGCVELRGRAPTAALRAAQPGDLIVATPDWWRAAAALDQRCAPDVVGVSSTAPLTAELARRLTGLGLSRLVEIYGASETAGLGWRDAPETSFRLFPWWRLTDGGDAVVHRRDGDVISAPDRLETTADGGVRPLGRVDGIVQVGGVNVRMDQVAAALCEHPAVRAAAVRPWARPEGLRLKAFLCLTTGETDPDPSMRTALARWIDARLTPPERPRHLRFGPALPVGAMGKAADWLIDDPPEDRP